MSIGNDLIIREKAIKTFIDWHYKEFGYADLNKSERFINAIELIPAVEPLVTVKAKQNEGLYLDTDEETLLETEYIVIATNGWYKEYIHETDGKPRVGKWYDHSDEGYVQCPFCGSLTTCEDNIDELHYCFNCGSKMEGRADE